MGATLRLACMASCDGHNRLTTAIHLGPPSQVETRDSLLDKLVRCELPLNETLLMLSACPWSSEESLHVLQPRDVIAVLDRYLEGDLDARQLQQWAAELEARTDIGYPRGLAASLHRSLAMLSNPDSQEPISPDLVMGLRNELAGEAG